MGVNQNTRKLLSTGLVNTNTCYILDCPHSLYDVPYSFRKPIAYKPPASLWA